MSLVAGHTFDEASGLCSCRRKFSDIAGAESSDIGKPHFAHVGDLTLHEFDQIVAERERLWRSLTGESIRVIGSFPDAADDMSG